MRTINSTILWLAALAVIVSFTSCDPMASVEYRIYNKTTDTVTVDMYREILVSSYQGFDIIENDSVTKHYGSEDTIHVAVLAPEQVLIVGNEWHGLYREEQVIPFWKYITSITEGKTLLPNEKWDNEAAWHLRTEGGGRFEDESRYYSIVFRDK